MPQLDKVQDQIDKLYKLVKSQPQISKSHMQSIRSLYGEVVRGLGKEAPKAPVKTPARSRRPSSQFLRPTAVVDSTFVPEDKIPLLHLKRKVGTAWQYSSKLTYVSTLPLRFLLADVARLQLSLPRHPQGDCYVRCHLRAQERTPHWSWKGIHRRRNCQGIARRWSQGCHYYCTLLLTRSRTVSDAFAQSRYSRASVEYYQSIYQECGSKGSSLTVVPFNHGSKQDVEALIDYIYSTDKGLGMDLDYILPFAALPENGREIDGLDDRSELAHRIMLTNLLRLLGAVKTKKQALKLVTRPTEVVLPLSPNHGLFGSDGLYSESKISLETLFNRWSSESWGEYLCIAGAVIGESAHLFSILNSDFRLRRMDPRDWIDERHQPRR